MLPPLSSGLLKVRCYMVNVLCRGLGTLEGGREGGGGGGEGGKRRGERGEEGGRRGGRERDH